MLGTYETEETNNINNLKVIKEYVKQNDCILDIHHNMILYIYIIYIYILCFMAVYLLKLLFSNIYINIFPFRIFYSLYDQYRHSY
jgi:hypothetical protein